MQIFKSIVAQDKTWLLGLTVFSFKESDQFEESVFVVMLFFLKGKERLGSYLQGMSHESWRTCD